MSVDARTDQDEPCTSCGGSCWNPMSTDQGGDVPCGRCRRTPGWEPFARQVASHAAPKGKGAA